MKTQPPLKGGGATLGWNIGMDLTDSNEAMGS
jgi:hypothetical protein